MERIILKNRINRAFNLLSMLCLLVAFTGCGALKSIKEKSTSTSSIEKTEVKKDSSTSVKVNKAINDEVSTTVQATGDPELDAKVDEILSRLNTSKSSGDNSYRFYYDAQLRELKAEFKVSQTKDSTSTQNSNIKTEKSFEENISEYIKKVVIPWWVYLIVIFVFRKQIIGLIAFIYPPIRGITSITDLLTPPNKDKNTS